jgi:hypothetical protein
VKFLCRKKNSIWNTWEVFIYYVGITSSKDLGKTLPIPMSFHLTFKRFTPLCCLLTSKNGLYP